MLFGLRLKVVFRRKVRLLFTSAAQRNHSGYTRWLIQKMDYVIATSSKSATYLRRPATVIRHGIDLTDFTPAKSKNELKAHLNLPSGTVVGIVGRVRHQKGTDVFIEAMLGAMESQKDLFGLVIGRTDDHEFKNRLLARIESSGKEDHFT